MSTLVGLDVGTTGARAVAVADDGAVVAMASAGYPLHQPRPGWSEQDPADWWSAARQVLARVASQLPGEIAGLGLTGQMHGATFLDGKDQVIRPALLWNDQRTAPQCRAINQIVGSEQLVAVTGNPAITGFQAPKILWLRDEEPDHYRQVAHVLLPKDFVRHRLTGQLATDASDASGTLLLDARARDWSDTLLEALELPAGWLPPVHESPEITGLLRPEVSRGLGLPTDLPVAAGAGDNAAAAVGLGVIRPGVLSCSIGTSGVVFSPTDAFLPDPSGRVHACCHAVPGAYHLMGVTLAAGGSLRWWGDLLGMTDFTELTDLAGSAPPGAGGLLFLPYLQGERTPHLDSGARGAFVGLTGRHGPGELTRAVMEGVAFSLRDSLEIIAGLGSRVREVWATGGGARSSLWLQILADVLRLPVRRPLADEGPAYGAALLAGVATGVYPDVATACERARLEPQVVEPDRRTTSTYDELYRLYRDLYAATREIQAGLAQVSAG